MINTVFYILYGKNTTKNFNHRENLPNYFVAMLQLLINTQFLTTPDFMLLLQLAHNASMLCITLYKRV